ncbi:hypothetical protein HPB47_023853 [Ixodes persulcatus]|uniref:Uncharacterized protein n=1 Tax=Ixodes persulcatus TaxID=34615 RepID=A0AC60Q8U4_IXOPE|nr:hypothetical protein HPB47_023853 [Ixodes persulcatus]
MRASRARVEEHWCEVSATLDRLAPRIRRTATTRAEKKSSKFPGLGGVFHGEARTTEILPVDAATPERLLSQDDNEWVHGSDTIVPDCPDWLRVFLSGSHRSLQDERGEASPQSGAATSLGIQGNGDQGDSSGSSSAFTDQRGVEQEMELIRAKEKLVRLELELERLRVENRPRSSASGAELSLREEVLSFSRLMKGVLTQMPSSELLVPSWFDGVENVFQTYEVPERLRGSLIRPYFTERMRALVNRLPVGEASEYGAVKERVLLELKMSPAEYRRLFLNATRAERESWTQFVTRVESCVEYYARSRGVESLEDLLALIVSDRVRDSMPADMQEYVTLNEGEKWPRPLEVAHADQLTPYHEPVPGLLPPGPRLKMVETCEECLAKDYARRTCPLETKKAVKGQRRNAKGDDDGPRERAALSDRRSPRYRNPALMSGVAMADFSAARHRVHFDGGFVARADTPAQEDHPQGLPRPEEAAAPKAYPRNPDFVNQDQGTNEADDGKPVVADPNRRRRCIPTRRTKDSNTLPRGGPREHRELGATL